MTAVAAPPAGAAAAGPLPGSGPGAVARRAFRQVRLSALVWGLVFGATVASSALTYVKSFPDAASRAQVAATTGGDAGLSILLGPINAIDTVGGYTVYKSFVFLTTIGAIWGLLAATRLLRGEEDTGRWQLVLAGGVRPAAATLATLAALGGAVGVIFVGTTALTLLAGRNPDVGFGFGDTVIYGLSIAVAPLVFVAVGALTSQLGRSRRVASALGMGAFGAAFVVRMVADSGPGTAWLLWLTPFGWIERMRPFTDPDLRPFVLAVVVTAALVAAATLLAARRDVGDGVLAGRDTATARDAGLGSPLGLAARLEWGVLVGWCALAAGAGLAFGIIGKIATGNIPKSLGDTLDRFGVHGTFLNQYLGVAFLFIATIVALVPASPLGAMAEDETSGRLVSVLALPTGRRGLLGGRLLLAAVGIVGAAVVGGLATWLGAASQGVNPGFWALLGAGLNVVPTALVVAGIGAVTLAVAPEWTTRVVYGVVVWSVIVDLLASLLTGAGWLDHLSLFHYMALAPSESPDAGTVVGNLVAAAVLAGVATWLYGRRDVGRG